MPFKLLKEEELIKNKRGRKKGSSLSKNLKQCIKKLVKYNIRQGIKNKNRKKVLDISEIIRRKEKT